MPFTTPYCDNTPYPRTPPSTTSNDVYQVSSSHGYLLGLHPLQILCMDFYEMQNFKLVVIDSEQKKIISANCSSCCFRELRDASG